MSDQIAPHAPPFCPNPCCDYHCRSDASWRWRRAGWFTRRCPPHRIQRFRCDHCRRCFSTQTFSITYWLRRPELLPDLFWRLLSCSGYRQLARALHVSPQTVALHAARLGRHCLLFHLSRWPRGRIHEPLCLDSFISFEFSHYHPSAFHLLVGKHSHFFYGFLTSELRRSGRMTARQRRRRARLERERGRPDPRATERDTAELLRLVAPVPQTLVLHSDEHPDYPRAIARASHLAIEHHTISSRAERTPRNPLFAVNLLDLLIRHSEANHKRETIAFSKRLQAAIDRLWILLAWRNYVKQFSERNGGGSPAARAGFTARAMTSAEILAHRLFATRLPVPGAWQRHYRRGVMTRAIRNCRTHRLRYAF
jgi:transposase-like protein